MFKSILTLDHHSMFVLVTIHVYYWGEPERAPPRALQRLRSLSHNGNNISYVLAPAYKRLYFIRDVTYISRAHALRANVKPAHRKFKGHQNLHRVRALSSWLCGSASHRLALIIVWQLATLLKEVRTSSIALRLLLNAPENSVRPHTH